MRWIVAVILIVCFATSTGCTMVADMLCGKLAEKHYTDAGTPEGRREAYQANVDEQRRIAERYSSPN
jgi:hypothetical protein